MMEAGKALLDAETVLNKLCLNPGMRVADFGCGRTGHFIFKVSKVVGPTGVVYAVDLMKDILESIQSRIKSEGYDNIQTVWSDIERLGYTTIPEGSLDACFFVNVLSMLKDRSTALLEASRLLKKSGKIMIIDWSKNLGGLGPAAGQKIDIVSLGSLATSSGLRLLDEFKAGEYHFGAILEK